MDKVIVLGHGNPYCFEKDGKEFKGVKINFINETPSLIPGEVGYMPIQVTLDPSILDDIKELPAVYEIGYNLKAGKNGKPEAVISNLKFVKKIDLQKLVQ